MLWKSNVPFGKIGSFTTFLAERKRAPERCKSWGCSLQEETFPWKMKVFFFAKKSAETYHYIVILVAIGILREDAPRR